MMIKRELVSLDDIFPGFSDWQQNKYMPEDWKLPATLRVQSHTPLTAIRAKWERQGLCMPGTLLLPDDLPAHQIEQRIRRIARLQGYTRVSRRLRKCEKRKNKWREKS